MTTALNNHWVDPALVVADAFRITLAEMPLHLRAILGAIADATGCLVDGAHYAKYEEHHLVRSCFSSCREQLEIALALLTEVERAPAPDFGAEPA